MAGQQPLLSNAEHGPNGSLVEPDVIETDASSWLADFRDIVSLAGPAILQLSFQQAVIVTNQSMAGHLGPDELAAAALAVTWFNLMWFFIIGASSALDTLASQAFGARDRPGVLSWAISAAVILSLMAIPMAIALYYGAAVAIHIFQQSPAIAHLVQIYCHGILPGLWPFIWSLVIMKAMQAQNFMWGPTLVTIGMFIANIPINMVLIKAFGFTGAAYAQSVSRIALFLFLIAFVTTCGNGCIRFDRSAWHLNDSRDEEEEISTNLRIREAIEAADGDSIRPTAIGTNEATPFAGKAVKTEDDEDLPYTHPTLHQILLDGVSKERLLTFLKLGSAGGLMMAADASSFDITTAMAGFLGVEEVGAHTCLLTIIEFIFTSFPYGIATAATIRVGNMLGAGKAVSARQSAYLSLAVCACFNVTVMVLFFVFGQYVGYIFTNDPTVVQLVAKLAILGGLYQIPDCFYGCISGILRGTGRQASLMWSNLAGFWGVGMPVCYLLAFRFNLGVEGLWIGLVVGLSTSALLVTAMLLMLDWDKEADAARALVLAMHESALQEEYDEEEDANGDTFLETAPQSGNHHLSRLERRRSSRSDSIPIQRSNSSQLLNVGSLTGSYARPMNSHL